MKKTTETPWQKGNLTDPVVFRAVVWTGKNFVGVGDGGKIAVGDSPTNMKFVSSGLNDNQHIFTVCNGKDAGTVLGMGRDGIEVISKDHGQTWKIIKGIPTPPARPDGTIPDIYGVIYCPLGYICIWETGGISTSPDGETWTYNPAPAGSLRCVGCVKGQVWIGTANGYLFTSHDLTSWRKERVDAGGIRSIVYSEKLAKVIVTGHNITVGDVSADNPKWKTTYFRPAGDGRVLMSSAAVGVKFYAAGDGGLCLESADGGSTWVIMPTDSLKHWLGFAQSSQYLVSVGNGGPKNNNPQYTHSVHYLSIDDTGGGGSGPGDGGGDDGGGGGGGDGGGTTEPGSDVQQMLRDALKKNEEARVLIQNALALVTTGRDEKPARKKK